GRPGLPIRSRVRRLDDGSRRHRGHCESPHAAREAGHPATARSVRSVRNRVMSTLSSVLFTPCKHAFPIDSQPHGLRHRPVRCPQRGVRLRDDGQASRRDRTPARDALRVPLRPRGPADLATGVEATVLAARRGTEGCGHHLPCRHPPGGANSVISFYPLPFSQMESTATPSATPGFDRHWLPWTFQWGFRGVRDTRGFSVARLGEVGATVQQIIGNGLLLAAAPELRDASQHLYNAIQDYLN